MCKKLRVEYCDLKKINEVLRYARKNTTIFLRPKEEDEPLGYCSFIDDKIVWFSITLKMNGVACTYKFKKDGSDSQQYTDGGEAFRILNEYYKVPRLDFVDIGSAKAIIYRNPKYEGKRVNAICYDLNSAYSNAMLKPMPDTTVAPRMGYIKKGEIGFIETEETGLTAVFSGYSSYIFPLMESPFKRFVEKWYEEKKNGNPKAKGILNYSVGYLQRVNPYLRAAIITYCNNTIKEIIDKYDDIIYCNTDSIVALSPKDLPLGDKIGQWKIEHEGLFAYIGFNFQWGYDAPHYRGKCRKWFKPGWDILKDPIPTEGNVYEFNRDKCRIEEVQ